MNIIGEKVIHSKFGEGVIVKQETSYIHVKFDVEVKKFSYPQCFEKFLKLQDKDVAAQISEIIIKQERKEKRKNPFISSEFVQSKRKKLYSNNGIPIQSCSSVEEFCKKYKDAIQKEYSYLREQGGKRQIVFDGRKIEYKNNYYIYTFISNDELKYPEGTQITIWEKGEGVPGYIVGCEDYTIIIASKALFGNEVPILEFSAEPWKLLSALMDRIDDHIMEKPSEIVRELVCDGFKSIDNRQNITTGQDNAVQMAQNQPITFVWGPPGTGKTQTLAYIARAHIKRGNRVLMLSHSNVSVDGAIMRVDKIAKQEKPGVLLRYGYPRRKDLLEHPYLTSYNLAIHNHPELLAEQRELVTERKRTSRNSARYAHITQRLKEIKTTLLSEEKTAVNTAQFVATTVSKAIVDKTIQDNHFDVVIFDEASMAYVPQIVFAASLAKKYFVCMGDFKQLPPIVQSDASMLESDIFEYCGISSAVKTGKNHKWLCLLDTQHRMAPQIAEFAGRTMYEGLLHSANDMEKKRESIVLQNPAANHAIALADISGMMSVCLRNNDYSRINILSAFISFSLGLEASKNCEVGIITPYHAQSRLLQAMARDASEINPRLKSISCATVHQFQGSEKDVIVFDAVDCYRMPNLGMLLDSKKNDSANRLFNVALTRARGKFIGVANVNYLEEKRLSKNLMLRKLIDAQKSENSCFNGEYFTHKNDMSESGMIFYNGKKRFEQRKQLLEDIQSAKQEIRLDIPDLLQTTSFVDKITTELQKKEHSGVKIYVRAENKQALPSKLKFFAIENSNAINPLLIIDKMVTWFGMPDSEANFKLKDNSIIKTKYRPIIRFEGEHTAEALYGITKMSNNRDESKSVSIDDNGKAIIASFKDYVLANKKCRSCGSPMRLHKTKQGKFMLKCTECGEREWVKVKFVDDYLYRNGGTGELCKHKDCHCSLEAKLGSHGVYVQCCSIAHHKYRLDEI